jgi:small subunit ribosomal protein S16
VAVKIRLKRLGKIRAPHYRVVVMDSRAKRDGRAIEEIGAYHPTQEPSLIQIDTERAQYWLGVGAQPTEQVAALLKITGDWQKFKGLPGAEGTLRVAEPRVDKKAVFEAAAKATADEPRDGATTPRKRVAPKKVAGSDDAAPAAEVPAAGSAGATAPAVADDAPATNAAAAPADEASDTTADATDATAAPAAPEQA